MQPFFSFWLVDDARLHSASTYVHCKAGKSRSVTVVLGYLIHANAWTLKTSYAYVAEKRRGISPNIGFVAELMQFEESELGLKATSGMPTPGGGGRGRGDHDKAASMEEQQTTNSRSRRNKYGRESLPPTWTSNDDDFGRLPSQDAGHVATSGDQAVGDRQAKSGVGRHHLPSTGQDLADQMGMNKEVRKNGQYVHCRR